MPRFDSPSIFARLLDENAGYWSIRPTGHSGGLSHRGRVHHDGVQEELMTRMIILVQESMA
ncbi:hypothetical protein KLK06_48585 [Nonomuraea sp. NEAU-A123]|nr:hypothetical protein [Nonomuraea sp. NEAU-A123]